MVIAARPELEHARLAAGDDRAPVGLGRDALHPGDGATLEIPEQRAPVERTVVGQAEAEALLGGQPVAPPASCAQLARRHPEDVAARAVELTDAAEARGEGDLAHAQIRLVEESPREVGARGAREAVGGHAELGREQPAQVARRDAEPGAELRLCATVERAAENELDRAADELGPVQSSASGERYGRQRRHAR